MNKSKLSAVPHVNYLGVVIDEFLSWDTPNCVIMFHNRLVFRYIYPCFTHLFYTAPYHGILLQKPILIVLILQKKCLRIIAFSVYKDHIIRCLKILSYLNSTMFWSQRS